MKTLSRTALLFVLTSFLALNGCEQASDENTTQWPLVKNCDLHQQACESKMGEARAVLKISPHPIPIAKPLGIELDLHNLQAEKVELDISGVNMYMGYNRVNLMSTKPGHYVGTSMLAFCTNLKMEWQITLLVHLADGKQIQIPYYLETVNR
ncbi:MAG: hypothetical protein U9R28_09050 [Pseudomonadota bacterium]|nr:hypothetical protein [Pseudomonadota bacterium]